MELWQFIVGVVLILIVVDMLLDRWMSNHLKRLALGLKRQKKFPSWINWDYSHGKEFFKRK